MGTGSEGKIRSDESTQWLAPLRCVQVSQVAKIATQSFPTPWNERDFAYFLAHDNSLSCGIFNSGYSLRPQLIAYFIGLLVQGDLDVISIATHPDFRRIGASRKLLEFVCGHPGVTNVFLEVDTMNTGAIQLYEALKFETISKRPGYYEGKRDALVMKWSKSS